MIDSATGRKTQSGARGRKGVSLMVLAALSTAISGCASLPVSGPTGNQVQRAAVRLDEPLPFRLVELQGVGQLPASLVPPVVARPQLPPPPSDMIGSGDVLDIVIYEAGVALFASTNPAAASQAVSSSFTGGAQATHLPPQRVTDSGYVTLPFAGRLRAAGHTPDELADLIRARLKGMSQNPQVLVSFAAVIANSVIVGGEVNHPGRLVLTTNRETVSDALALSGGYRGDAKDLSVLITRKGADFEYRLSDILRGAAGDMAVLPGDRIEVLRKQQVFSVLGAPSKVDRMPFPSATVSLAEAVAVSGGANPQAGNAKAIFVFRYVPEDDGTSKPVVYHLNMMEPGAYFLSQQFMMRDKDVLYIGNAAANQPTKLVQLVSQLFSPILTTAVVVKQATN